MEVIKFTNFTFFFSFPTVIMQHRIKAVSFYYSGYFKIWILMPTMIEKVQYSYVSEWRLLLLFLFFFSPPAIVFW